MISVQVSFSLDSFTHFFNCFLFLGNREISKVQLLSSMKGDRKILKSTSFKSCCHGSFLKTPLSKEQFWVDTLGPFGLDSATLSNSALLCWHLLCPHLYSSLTLDKQLERHCLRLAFGEYWWSEQPSPWVKPIWTKRCFFKSSITTVFQS